MNNQISKNLKTLITRTEINVTGLARETGISQPVLHRIVTGDTPNPRIGTLVPIARYFGVTIGQLVGDEPFEMHGLKVGQVRAIPHLPMQKISDWQAGDVDGTVDYYLYQDNLMGQRCFATTLLDTTMRQQFPEGTIIVVDPEQPHNDQDYVLARLDGDHIPVFRQLVKDGSRIYLKALNQDFELIKVKDPATDILGVFIQARISGNRLKQINHTD